MKERFYNFFSLVGEFALYGLLFFLPISNALVETFAVFILFGFIGRKIIKPDFKYLKFWPNIFLLIFLFFSALSLFNSGIYLNKSLHAVFAKWTQYLGICVIVQDNIYDTKVIKRGVFVFLLGASLAVLSGLSQNFFGVEFLRGRGMSGMNDGSRAMTSSFNHHNTLGGYLVVVLSLVIALLLANGSAGLQANSLSVLSLFLTLAIILTFSRGSWLGASIAFLFTASLSNKNFKRLIPLFFVVIVLFLFPVFYGRLSLIFKAGGDSDRFRYWLAALNMIKDHPFLGIGAGTFMANFSRYLPNSNVSYAHNCYLQIWAETGVFSLISFLLFTGSIIYLGVKKFLSSQDCLLLGLLSGAIGFLVHSFFDTNLYSLRLAILFWVWVGLIIARIRVGNQ